MAELRTQTYEWLYYGLESRPPGFRFGHFGTFLSGTRVAHSTTSHPCPANIGYIETCVALISTHISPMLTALNTG